MIAFHKTSITYPLKDIKGLKEILEHNNNRLSSALDVALGMGIFGDKELPRRAVFIVEWCERILADPELSFMGGKFPDKFDGPLVPLKK
jgi:hypothetical protein